VKLTITPYLCISIKFQAKIAEFHRIKIPPEAPTEGEYTKLSNLLGQHFLINL
jgi:hypothetical protein